MAEESGLSLATVKTARRRLREVGLIGYADSVGGENRQAATTTYALADIRRPDVAAECCSRIAGDLPLMSAAAPVAAVETVPLGDCDDDENDRVYEDDGFNET